MAYYGIYTPSKVDSDIDKANVFTEKSEALKVLKDHKDGRLKVFKNIDDATKYAKSGFEITQVKFADLKSPSATIEKAAFRAPSKQELVQFRKFIEADNLTLVKTIMWDNPRYLVNSGDTPTNLKEGYRYNALHVCAMQNKPQMARLILETINNPKFVELLHGKWNDKVCQEVSDILLDYYLNMPEKGRNETPLHLATKYGAVEVVEVLTSYPHCKMLKNFEEKLPEQIICDRVDSATPELKTRISELLKERFYVPVIRSVDNTVAPTIGEPFSLSNPPELNTDPLSSEVEIQAVAGPMSKEQAQTFRRRWKTPPRNSNHSLNSSLGNTPFISPVKYRSTTPKSMNNNNSGSTPVNYNKKALFANRSLNLQAEDSSNGNHSRNGSLQSPNENNNSIHNGELNAQTASPDVDYQITPLRKNPQKRELFFAYRERLGSPMVYGNESNAADVSIMSENDFGSPVGSNRDENELPNRLAGLKLASPKIFAPIMQSSTPVRTNPLKKEIFGGFRAPISSPLLFDGNESNVSNGSLTLDDTSESIGLKERHLKLTDTEKGLEMIGRELAKEQNIEWKEYWDFLGSFVDIASPKGLEMLEDFLKNRAEVKVEDVANTAAKKPKETLMSTLCCALDKLALCKENQMNTNEEILNAAENRTIAPQSKTPHLCVDNSLQVFAKRMTKTILNNIESAISINDTFLSELKRLKSLICSFKCDSRILNVDFAVVHSRCANLIATYLESSQEVDSDALEKINKCFNLILTACSRNNEKTQGVVNGSEKKDHLHCVSEFLLKYLNEKEIDKIMPDNLKTEQVCAKIWENEVRCDCVWESKLSRQESRKKRFESKNAARIRSDVEEKPTVSTALDTKSWRPQSCDSSNDSICDADDDDNEDIFWSDIGSESDDDERFYTPPESPSMLEYAEFDFENYNLYMLGNEPTKRDLDVLNAIFHVEINKEKYPNLYRWRAAILHHPNDERDNFPSPSVVVKKRNNSISTDDRLAIAKRLFMSPSRTQPIRNRIIRNRISSTGSSSPMSCASPGSSASKNLSFMNVSDVSDC